MRNRISVTTLDQFQAYLDNEDMDEPSFISTILNPPPPTHAMAVGTAWHKVLESWQGQSEDNRYHQDGLCFDLSRLDSDDLIEIGEPHQREKKLVWQGVDGVDLVGKFDVLLPFAVIDHKLTANFDPERYFNSWQWRCYLTMTGKPKMVYQVFEHAGLNLSQKQTLYDDEIGFHELTWGNNNVYIKNYHRLEVLAYDGMAEEVADIVAKYNQLLINYGVTR